MQAAARGQGFLRTQIEWWRDRAPPADFESGAPKLSLYLELWKRSWRKEARW